MPRVIKLYYLQRFFSHLILFWAVDKVFFLSQGITPFQLSLLLGAWSLHTLIFEVPSGAIADKWSRKWVLVIGSAFHTLAYVWWIFATNFWGFLIGYLLRGTGGFLESGTREALVYDHLKIIKLEHKYEEFTGKLWIITTVSFLIASLSAGGLADKYSFTLVLVLSALARFIATLVALTIPEAPISQSTQEKSYWKFLKTTWKKALMTPTLLTALVYGMTIIGIDDVLDEYDQLYVNFVGLPLRSFAVWWFLRMTGEGLAGLVAHRFKRFRVSKVLHYIAITSCVLLIPISLIQSPYMLPIYALLFFVFGIAKLLNEGRLQKMIHSHERATLNSINSLLIEFTAITTGILYGAFSSLYNPAIAMLIFPIIIAGYLFFQKLLRSKTRELIQ